MKKLSEILEIEHILIDENNFQKNIIPFENYMTYGGGGSGSKNGHFGCKHSEKTKKRMSEMKKNKPTWNKGIKGYKVHTDFSKKSMSQKLKGSKNGRAILSENDARNIIELYLQQPLIDSVGKIMPNGKKMSYIWAFCNQYALKYHINPATIKRLLTKKTWKNVWSEFKI